MVESAIRAAKANFNMVVLLLVKSDEPDLNELWPQGHLVDVRKPTSPCYFALVVNGAAALERIARLHYLMPRSASRNISAQNGKPAHRTQARSDPRCRCCRLQPAHEP